MYYTPQNCLTEWTFKSNKTYDDPFNEVTLDVLVTRSDGQEQRVPAFWAGEQTWCIRYATQPLGEYHWRTLCSDSDNPDLHDRTGQLSITPYQGKNILLRHGTLQVNQTRRYLEHRDETPFFWLGDTWWMGLCERLGWPGDFKTLTADRVNKGFSVIQLVAGLYPDMPAFDNRARNEAGFPWEKDFTRINPAYFDIADLRIDYLVNQGLVPCILGCWGYYLKWMGQEKMKQHWRYLVARYGAYPVVWCLAGEAAMPYYLSEQKEEDQAFLRRGWTEIGRYVKDIDPYHHPLTIHPTQNARDQVEDDSILDLEMLQTGHSDRRSIPRTLRQMQEAYQYQPRRPVLNSEVCYEGIGAACREEVQRFMFWICLLNGACGHTYGANGIWQVNRSDRPYGASPHGMAWGHTPWPEAAQLPGSKQLGFSKNLLENYAWWSIEPHPEWVYPQPQDSPDMIYAPYAGGVPGKLRLIFLPSGVWNIIVQALEAESSYQALLFNPVTGETQDLGPVEPDETGRWSPPLDRAPIFQDWILVLEAQ